MAGNQQSLPFFILLLIKKWIHWWSLAIWILMKEYFQKKIKGKRRWISRPTLSQKPRRLWSVKKKKPFKRWSLNRWWFLLCLWDRNLGGIDFRPASARKMKN
jgi:hypothetical protein